MFVLFKMAADNAARRLQQLNVSLKLGVNNTVFLRQYVTAGEGKIVTLGDVSTPLKQPKNPELVPVLYLPQSEHGSSQSQALLKHLRWIMQKDVLGQDVFLIGSPGPLRRLLAMMYLEMTQRELEYISLSRDTTETDLKQRREIKSGSAYHLDQCAVRAAIHGRVLVLEGIEKAERNVLPVLNNLLENREMQLDDGRFLMAAERYDKLLQQHSKEELDKWKLVRVNERFRVIALGLPVPRYQGNPLDPPLRSRFQAREITSLPFNEQAAQLTSLGKSVGPDRISKILSFASTLKSEESVSLGLPDFPMDNLPAVLSIAVKVPSLSAQRLISRLYPAEVMLNKEGQTSVKDALKTFEMLDAADSQTACSVTEIRRVANSASVDIRCAGQVHTIQVMAGTLDSGATAHDFVSTAYHEQLLADLMMSHMVKDMCIVGPRGCGKSALVSRFADLLGYQTEHIMLYQDMTARDLLQQRMTLPNGDTAWRHTPLVTAALSGSLAVLDGVHRVNAGSFAVLQRLIHDRELALYDGTRLLQAERYDEIKKKNNLSDEAMLARGIYRIHPSFRIIALSEPPVVGSSSQQWLNAEMLTMFLYHHMRSLSEAEEVHVIGRLVPDVRPMGSVMHLTHRLRDSGDTSLKAVATSLSTRQLLRVARRLAKYPSEDVYNTVHKATLARFLPRITRSALEAELEKMSIVKASPAAGLLDNDRTITCEIKNNELRIGDTVMPVYQTDAGMKVPDVLFYENIQHLEVMEDMLKDFMLGEHLLLVGNQGVGKNKIVDRFLHLLNRPREYLQLHRDTTVQTLTLQPTVRDGVIIHEDSPLVRAVKSGHILVVDEADKAPTHVTCILKTLVESGEMHLADGRQIVHSKSGVKPSAQVIFMHPDFRMIVLANRPGFPFLGNDFFGAMGDIFSAHAVDNPDPASEMAMLRQYGPDVPEELLRKLISAFGELRDKADQGLITYPYSTREVVNMVRHLQKYPGEGLVNVVKNVFDFDAYNKELRETITETLHKHGIPLGADPRNVFLAKQYALPLFEPVGQWNMTQFGDKAGLCDVNLRQIRVKGPMEVPVQAFPLERTEARSLIFTEQEAFWTIPIHETSVILDVAVTKGGSRRPGQINDDIIHITTANPICLYSMNARSQRLTCVDLYDLFPTTRGSGFRPRVRAAPLGFPLDNNVVIHEELSNTVLNVDWQTGRVSRLETNPLLESITDKVTRNFRTQQGVFKMCGQYAHDGLILFYKQHGESIERVTMLDGQCLTISLPIKFSSIVMLSLTDWLLAETDSHRKFILSSSKESPNEYKLKLLATDSSQSDVIEHSSLSKLPDTHLSHALGQQISSPSRLLAGKNSYATIAVGLPDLTSVEVYSVPRPPVPDSLRHKMYGEKSSGTGSTPTVLLPTSNQIVRCVPEWQVPEDALPEGASPKYISGYLEVVDIVSKKLRYIPVPGVTDRTGYRQWFNYGTDVSVAMAVMSNDGLVTVDSGGCVRLWEMAMYQLGDSVNKWQQMIGDGQERPLQVTYERELDKQVPPDLMPKHGQVDPTGARHVGGNTFAGGMGGMGTAGLGGVGGPYRLSGGEAEVFQVPDWQKDQVPEQVKRAAREMAQKAWKEKLRQIQMSEYDGEMYEKYANAIRSQVKTLRVILDTLQAKSKEREWLRNQTYGDLDEAKLIEGLAGEKAVFKRRGEREPELGSPQQKPKHVKLLCDVSGSMYRFDGADGRLERQLESMLLIMEALEGYSHKVKYDIIGHSGEGPKFDMVTADNPPKNNKERLTVLKNLHAHSQFCISGDNTLEAIDSAVKAIVKEEADEHFVIALSDANLDRYGIRPKALADILTSTDDVNAYVIFIGSLGDQASRLIKQLPAGRAYMCMDTKDLPHILQQIFTSTMLS